MENKIGAYICSGCDIDQALDVEEMAKVAEKEFRIPVSRTHPTLCSEDGVKMLKADRDQEGVNRFMIAACSPRQHEQTFDMGEENIVVRAPIREYVAWVQEARDSEGKVNEDTQMAGEDYVRIHCSQVKKIKLPTTFEQETSRNLLVIGGGLSGMTAALEAAKAGCQVDLVEKKERLGGYILDQYKLLPVSPPFQSPQQNNTEELVSLVENHKGISVHKSTHVTSISGQPGEFSVRLSQKGKKIKFNEKSEFNPKSPYGVSKLFSHFITKVYRESYGIYAASGILFNHESPRRGETFVTRKITMFLAKYILTRKGILRLGNIYAKRDWGHAKDYVEMQWRILQQKKPDDYVISTDNAYSVKEFINLACKILKIKLVWSGKGLNEKGYEITKNNKKKLFIKIDKKYFRPLDINYLRGDHSKAKKY